MVFVLFKIKKPTIPPVKDAMKIPILASRIKISFLKAKLVTKSDIVNPIDAKSATPIRCWYVIPDGKSANLNFIKRVETPKIPINFPKIKPKIISSV